MHPNDINVFLLRTEASKVDTTLVPGHCDSWHIYLCHTYELVSPPYDITTIYQWHTNELMILLECPLHDSKNCLSYRRIGKYFVWHSNTMLWDRDELVAKSSVYEIT